MIEVMSQSVYTTDTSLDALAVQIDGLRRMTPKQRIGKVCAMSNRVRKMAFDAIRRRHPKRTDNEVRLLFIELTYGKQLADDVRLSQVGSSRE